MIAHKCPVLSTYNLHRLNCNEEGHFDCIMCEECLYEFHGLKRPALKYEKSEFCWYYKVAQYLPQTYFTR